MTTRFDWMLPRYLTKIADFNDLLEAEDQEFQRIEDRLLEVSADSTLTTMVSYDTLRRLEWIFAVKAQRGETFDQRVQRLKSKLVAYETTTTEAIERLAERITQVPAKVIEENENYYFRVEITLNEWRGILTLVEAIHEIKPAHLGFRLDVEWRAKRIYIGMFERRYRRVTVDWEHFRGGERKIPCYIGFHTMMSRNIEVPFGVPTKQEKKGQAVEAIYMKMCRRYNICSMER